MGFMSTGFMGVGVRVGKQASIPRRKLLRGQHSLQSKKTRVYPGLLRAPARGTGAAFPFYQQMPTGMLTRHGPHPTPRRKSNYDYTLIHTM